MRTAITGDWNLDRDHPINEVMFNKSLKPQVGFEDIPEEYRKGNKRESTVGIWLIGLIICAAIAGGILLDKNVRKNQQIDSERPSAVAPPTINMEGAPKIKILPIKIETKWSLLAGRHPTVTFSGQAQPQKERIERCFFAYRSRNAEHWEAIDATRKEKINYTAKLRDLEKNVHYEYCLVAVTKSGNFASAVQEFKIEGK